VKLFVVGLGAGTDGPTLRGLRALRAADAVFVRTDKTASTDCLRDEGISFHALDALYEQCEDYDALCAAIADAVLGKDADTTAYAVPGGATIGDATVAAVVAACRAGGIEWEIVPGIGWEDVAAASAGGVEGALVISAADYAMLSPDPRRWLIVTEMDRREAVSELKLRLLDSYPAEHGVLFCGEEIPLCEIDRQALYRYDSALAVPPLPLRELERFDFLHLMEIMAALRDPAEGSPWNGEQTHETLKPYLVEEAYEVVDAVDSGDELRLADELGDILLQVAFHARIGEEFGEFSIGDVTTAVCRKMLSRYAYIFGGEAAGTAAEVEADWEKSKKREKGFATAADVLRDVPRSFPALIRAQKLLEKAESSGLSWDVEWVAGRVARFVDEAADALLREEQGSADVVERIAGEMILYAVELLRKSGISVEHALYRTCEKFVETFAHAEETGLLSGNLGNRTAAERFAEWLDA